MSDWINKALTDALSADNGDIQDIGGMRYRRIGVVPRDNESAIQWRDNTGAGQTGGQWNGKQFDFQSPTPQGMELWQLIREFLGS